MVAMQGKHLLCQIAGLCFEFLHADDIGFLLRQPCRKTLTESGTDSLRLIVIMRTLFSDT